ncbi:regulator of G-protein signaling 22 [Heptranchias perlo]|uniref:regulator of G-protein signaling 22 n=1 Tax=Heptranchias perlo TaxID=212740 RepID=UPI003559DDEF
MEPIAQCKSSLSEERKRFGGQKCIVYLSCPALLSFSAPFLKITQQAGIVCLSSVNCVDRYPKGSERQNRPFSSALTGTAMNFFEPVSGLAAGDLERLHKELVSFCPEDYLVTDDLLVDYFNVFLRLLRSYQGSLPVQHMLHVSNEAGGKNMVNYSTSFNCEHQLRPSESIRCWLRSLGDSGSGRQSCSSWVHNKSFPKPIWFNKETGTFEIVDDAKKNLLKQLKNLLRAYTPVDPIYNVTIKSKRKYSQFEEKITPLDLKFETKFTVTCLDREQGVAWIKKERLPTFLKSDCYFEYRLAKLLSQTYPGMVMEESGTLAERYDASVTQTEALFTQAVEELPMIIIQAAQRPTASIRAPLSQTSVKSFESGLSGISLLDDVLISIEAGKMPTRSYGSRRRIDRAFFDVDQHMCHTGFSKPKVVDDKLFEFVPEYALQEPGTVFLKVKSDSETEPDKEEKENDEEQVSTDDKTTTQEEEVRTDDKTTAQSSETNLPSTLDQTKPHLDSNSKIDTNIAPKSNVSQTDQLNVERSSAVSDNVKTQGFSDNMGEESTESDSSNEEDDIRDFCYVTPRHSYNFKNRKSIEKFKKFLHGTAGEKYWWLWMDIERLKVIKDGKRKQSYLNKIRNRYLFSGGEYCMNAETRARLGLSFVSHWTVENLCQIQPDIVAPLLLYWGPRYCINQGFPIRQAGIALKDWEDRQLRPKSDVGPFAKTANRPKLDCTPKESHPTPTFIDPSSNPRIRNDIGAELQSASMEVEALTGPWLLLNCGSVAYVNADSTYCIVAGQTFQDAVAKERCRLNSHTCQSLYILGDCLQSLRIRTMFLKHPLFQSLLLLEPPVATVHLQGRMAEGEENIEHPEAEELEESSTHDDTASLNLTLMQITKHQEALCNYKMDSLLKALHDESRAGYFFTHFCEQTGNPLWSNGMNLWFDLKEYQRLFYAEIFQPFKLRRQAQFIFATYIVEEAPADVEVDTENKKIIFKKLEPPFEELFDQVEEHVLILLLVPWMHMIEMDISSSKKVELVRETRYLDSKYYKKLQELHRKIFPNEAIPLPVRSASLIQIPEDTKGSNQWQKVPEEFRNYTLNTFIRNRLELENFQAFLRENLAGMDLMCWLDIEHFRRIPHNEKENRDNKSKEIKSKYLNRKYFFGPSSPATKVQQDEVMTLAGGWGKLLHDQLSSNVLIEVQKYVKVRMEGKWLPMFLATPEFEERHHKRLQMQDVVEDQMSQKGRKKRDVVKHLHNKWLSSSKEIIAFRKALLNPVTALQFQQYVSLKGELMENNVLFWLEVQKYKDMCHSHANEETIQNKITAIIKCFINSSIPPPVQIDIPPEYAYYIINQRQEQGPYIFREAQMAVFEVLFKQWPEFSDFRRKIADERILPSLERKRMEKEEKMKRKRLGDSSTENVQDLKNKDANQQLYSDTGSKSSGSQLSLKGGSGKPTQDQHKIKTEIAGSSQQGAGLSQKISWSFSKYMETLNKEKELILRERKIGRKESAPEQVPLPELSASHITTPTSLSQSSNESSEIIEPPFSRLTEIQSEVILMNYTQADS